MANWVQYDAIGWISHRRDHLPSETFTRYKIVSNSDDYIYCVKLFATRSVKPVDNKNSLSPEFTYFSIKWWRKSRCLFLDHQLTRMQTIYSRREMRCLRERGRWAACLTFIEKCSASPKVAPSSYPTPPPTSVLGPVLMNRTRDEQGIPSAWTNACPRLTGRNLLAGVRSLCT